MITTSVITLAFAGDERTNQFDVQIEGIPAEPAGAAHFAVSRKDAAGGMVLLRYGVDYSYTANIVNGFSQNFRLILNEPLPDGESIIVLRTTPVVSISYYPENKTPPKQVEADIDNIIKILQEQGAKIDDLSGAMEELRKRDEDLQEQIDDKLGKHDPLPAHASQHAERGIDPLTPEMIGALREAPDDGGLYAATTVNGTPSWVRLLFPGGELSATVVVQVAEFAGDGTSMEFGLPLKHTLDTVFVQAVVYEAATGRRVHFPVTVPDKNTVILQSAVPIPAGEKYRCMLYGMGRIDPAWLKDVVTHPQDTTATEWVINHGMRNRNPLILALNRERQIVVPDIDYKNATKDSITLRFPYNEENGVPGCSGVAILYGWVGENIEIRRKPYSETFTDKKELVIHHGLGTTRPTVLVLGAGNTLISGDIDYENATGEEIVIRFAKPRSGEVWIGAR